MDSSQFDLWGIVRKGFTLLALAVAVLVWLTAGAIRLCLGMFDRR